MHPIEPFLPTLRNYCKGLVRGCQNIDHKDVLQDAILAVLKANPNRLTIGYCFFACKTRFYDALSSEKKHSHIELNEDYCHTYTEPYDVDELYERELLLNWAEPLCMKRLHVRGRSPEEKSARKKAYLKQYRMEKRNGRDKANN